MNNIEKELSDNFYVAVKEGEKEIVKKRYDAYRIYVKALEGEKDNELFSNVLLKYGIFMKEIGGERNE